MKALTASISTLALTAAGAAQAAEWDVNVGGYFNAMVGYADVDSPLPLEHDGVDAKQDAEIYFRPSITLDNGIKIGAHIELEGNTSTDQIDESYAFIRGSFGEVLIGSENSAGYKLQIAAPDSSIIGLNSGSLTAFIPFGEPNLGNDIFRGSLGTTYLEVDGNNDAQRITYFTPTFSGFKGGISYARDGLQDDNNQINTNNFNTLSDVFDVGVRYANDFGGIRVAASGRYGVGSFEGGVPGSGSASPSVYGFGLNLGYAGITVGGSWAEQDGDNISTADGQAYDVGASYETGPWIFSFTYFHGENIDNETAQRDPLTGRLTTTNDEELDQFQISVGYELAKGVGLNLFGAYADFDEEFAGGDDINGFVIGTGMALRF